MPHLGPLCWAMLMAGFLVMFGALAAVIWWTSKKEYKL